MVIVVLPWAASTRVLSWWFRRFVLLVVGNGSTDLVFFVGVFPQLVVVS